jgi:hypothetical protein
MADLRGLARGGWHRIGKVRGHPRKELVIKVGEVDAGRMPWTAPQIICQHAPYVAGERTVLGEWLEFRRLPRSSGSERPRPGVRAV